MTYNTCYTTHASVDFFAIKSSVRSDATDYIAISPAYQSAIQCRFPVVLKRDGLTVSNHVLYVIGSTLSLVGSGRRSIVAATHGSQRVSGWNRPLKVALSL